jgi:hypothetical protein
MDRRAAPGRRGPADEVFTLEPDTGSVRFGDGVHGKQPPRGTTVSVAFGSARGGEAVSLTTTWPPVEHRYELAVSAAQIGLRPCAASMQAFNGVTRVRFFAGKLLTADDLNAEQHYVNQKRYLHNRALHGIGIVHGLDVGLAGASAPEVTISPGLAVDRCGREVLVVSPIGLPIAAATSPVYVVIDYCERETGLVPLSGASEATRIEEGAALRLAAAEQIGDGVAVGRLVYTADVWALDRTFAPPRLHAAR